MTIESIMYVSKDNNFVQCKYVYNIKNVQKRNTKMTKSGTCINGFFIFNFWLYLLHFDGKQSR